MAKSIPSFESGFMAILNEAVTVEGVINKAYSAFHRFSLRNQVLAALQLRMRGVELSPIATYQDWKKKNRQVQGGSKALWLYMPVTITDKNNADDETKNKKQVFVLKNNWFALNDTKGEDFPVEVKTPEWDAKKAMEALDIKEVGFDSVRGNYMGWACNREIAINPLNPLKHKTRFHEMAHVVLGHTTNEVCEDNQLLPADIKEIEAEGVAYILTSLLNMQGQAESRDYIQRWLGAGEISEKSAKNIFNAANKILKAGQPVEIVHE